LVVWPSGFTARLDDLHFDLPDERGDIAAKGGELITIGGGFLAKDGDPRTLGHETFFTTSAREVSRAPTKPKSSPIRDRLSGAAGCAEQR
jgi:hypothetical protein